MLEISFRDERWLLGYQDWHAERRILVQELVEAALRTEPSSEQYDEAYRRLGDRKVFRLLHVAMGLATEAGEFVDQLKKHIFYGKDLDLTNLIEELGDSNWYECIGTDVLEVALVVMIQRNRHKLRVRFPEKFREAEAIERDLDKEREALS